MDAALALRGQGRPCLRRASLSSIFLFLFGKCPDSFSLFPSQNVPPGSIGSYVAEEGPIEFSNWNGISVRGRVALDSLDFPGIWWKAEGVGLFLAGDKSKR